MECYISGSLVRNEKWKRNHKMIAPMQFALSPVLNKENCEHLNQLFFGSGETFAITRILNPHIIATMVIETQHKTLVFLLIKDFKKYISYTKCVIICSSVSISYDLPNKSTWICTYYTSVGKI